MYLSMKQARNLVLVVLPGNSNELLVSSSNCMMSLACLVYLPSNMLLVFLQLPWHAAAVGLQIQIFVLMY